MKKLFLMVLFTISLYSCSDVLNDVTDVITKKNTEKKDETSPTSILTVATSSVIATTTVPTTTTPDPTSTTTTTDPSTSTSEPTPSSKFIGTSWKYVTTDYTETLTFNSDGTYIWVDDDQSSDDDDFEYKGTYSASDNSVTLTSLTYAKHKKGNAWTGNCSINYYMSLLDDKLSFSTFNCNNGTGLVNTWTVKNFLITYNPNSDYDITSVSTIDKKIILKTDNTFTQDYKRTYIYNPNDKEDEENHYSGIYSSSGNKVTITYSDDSSTSELILSNNYLFASSSRMGYLTSIAVPSNLVVTNTTNNSVSLQWSAVLGAQKYKVYYGTTESNLTYVGETTNPYFVINSLTANTTYYFSVSAYNGWAEGPKCAVISRKTNSLLVSINETFEYSLSSSWTSDTTSKWYRTTDNSYQGSYSLRSGAIGNYGSTSVSINSTGSTVSFYAKVSSEERYDKLFFYIDGVKKMEISGNIDWQKYTYTTTSGTHTFKWVYSKDVDDTNPTYSDCAWIDNVIISSGSGFQLVLASEPLMLLNNAL